MAIANLDERIEQIERILRCQALPSACDSVAYELPIGSMHISDSGGAPDFGYGVWALAGEENIAPQTVAYFWKRIS